MSYDLASTPEHPPEPSLYKLTHFRVFDDNGFVGAFGTSAPENATLETVTAYLCSRFAETGATGFDSKDMVILLGSRIVAVVLKGADGKPEVIKFER